MGGIISLMGCAPLRHGQPRGAPFCLAPSTAAEAAPTSWHSPTGAIGTPLPPSEVAQKLVGTWDVLEVATEGAAPADVERWRLRLVKTQHTVWYQCALGSCRTQRVAVVAAGAPVRQDALFDTVAASERRLKDAGAIDARYDSTTNHLTFSPEQLVLDAGTFYAVTEVSDTFLAGRWTDGSYISAEVQRGGAMTFEHRSGFFCARRRGP